MDITQTDPANRNDDPSYYCHHTTQEETVIAILCLDTNWRIGYFKFYENLDLLDDSPS